MRRLATALVLAGVGATTAILAGCGSAGSYAVRAEFSNANGLRKDFTVRSAGVRIGRVVDVEVTPRDTAIATLRIDRAAAPIGRDARAAIEPSNLLGEKYVSIQPGDRRSPAPSGTLIPLARTSVPVELDQVLNTFDSDTRRAVAVFLAQEGDALLGRGRDLATTLQWMPASLDSSRELLAAIGHDNKSLGRLVDASDRILATVTPRRAALGKLVRAAGGAFATLASRDRALGRSIEAAPPMLRQLRSSLAELDRASRPLGVAAQGLRRTAAPLTNTLKAVPGFARAARPALAALTRTAPSLRRLGVEGTPAVRALHRTADSLDTTARLAAPVSSTLERAIPDILGVAEGWARAITDRDGVGHVFRVEGLLPPSALRELVYFYTHPQTSQRRRLATQRPRPQLLPEREPPAAVHVPDRLPDVLKAPQVQQILNSPAGQAEPRRAHELLDFLLAP